MNWYLKVLKQYADFEGRARRKEYWMFALINMIISYAIGFVFGFIGGMIDVPEIAFIGSIYSLAVLVPSIAVAIRRMHDVGKSGWYCLIPFYNLYLAIQDSEEGENEYGPNPKGIGNSDELDEIGNNTED